MKMGVIQKMGGGLIASTAAFLCLCGPNALTAESKAVAQEVAHGNWREFHSVTGKCSLQFPSNPEYVTESINVPDEGYDLRYDAYISSMDPQTVFMLLVAQYPEFVDEAYAKMSLEGFLNGILVNNPSNQLISADLTLVDGREALDFFIRTGSVYFKGRALMIKNCLYLMAMECEMQNFNEKHFSNFIGSFQLKQS